MFLWSALAVPIGIPPEVDRVEIELPKALLHVEAGGLYQPNGLKGEGVVGIEEVSDYAPPRPFGRLSRECYAVVCESFIERIDVIGVENDPGSPFPLGLLAGGVQADFG